MASMNTRSRFPGLVHPMVVPVVLPRTMFSGAGDHRFYRISLTLPPCLSRGQCNGVSSIA